METLRDISLPPIEDRRAQNTTVEERLPAWSVILLLLTVFPVGVVYIVLDDHYHSWFPILLWVSGAPLIGGYLVELLFLPQVITLYESSGQRLPLTLISTFVLIAMTLAWQVTFGFILKKRLVGSRSIPRTMLWLAVATIYVNWFASGFTIYVIIQPLYRLLSKIQ